MLQASHSIQAPNPWQRALSMFGRIAGRIGAVIIVTLILGVLTVLALAFLSFQGIWAVVVSFAVVMWLASLLKR